MRKKGKSEAKSLPEAHDQRPLSGSLDTDLCDLRGSCSHFTYGGTAYLLNTLRDILASKCAGHCQFCLKDALVKKEDGNDLKNIGKKKKRRKGSSAAKVQRDVVEIHMWVCLTCNEHFCVAADIKAGSHAQLHAKQTQHWWATNHSDPSSVYCFKCDREGLVHVQSLFAKKVEIARSDLRFRIQGLQSLGNDACFNGLLQNLLSPRLLRKELLLHLEFPRAAPLSIALRELFVRTSWTNAGGALDQGNILSQVCTIYPEFRMFDSEKSFQYLLDALRIEEKKAWAGVPTVANSNIYDSVFAGQCSITVSCNKCSVIAKDQDFNYLSLPVPSVRAASGVVPLVNTQAVAGTDDVDERNSPVSIESCLKLYTDLESWMCEQCNNTEGPRIEEVIGGCKKGQDNKDKQEDDKMMVSHGSTRRVLIRIPPLILTLHLKRSSKDCHGQSKNLKGHVRYKENLDIRPFMDPRSRVDGQYRLVGTLMHTETLTGGHYVANVKANVPKYKGDTALRWFTAMDEQVQKLAFPSFEGEAHLLFYQKVVQENKDGEGTKVIEEANNDKQGQAEVKEMLCKETAPVHAETHPEQVKTPLPLAFETAEGSHSMRAHGNVIRGLSNLGNSCFFDAMLQILLSLDPLRCKMLEPDTWTGPLSSPLKQFFVDTSALNPARGSLNPRDLFTRTCAACSEFKIGRQEDSHEAVRGFLDALREEESKVQNLPMDVPVANRPTVVNSIFSGSLVSTTTYIGCKHCSTKTDPFLGIELSIPSGSSSIEDCWALYTEPTGLENLDCQECTDEQIEPIKRDAKGKPIPVKRNGMQKHLIGMTPHILVVNLKRYGHSLTSGSRKLEVNVRFEEMFDLQPFMKERSVEINTLYRLVGVVVHDGDIGQGHYVSYVRANDIGSQMNNSNDKSWFFVSDEHTRKVSLDEVLKCKAYILFYEKCLANACQSSGDTDSIMEPYSSAKPSVEESQVTDVNMQQAGASASDLSPSPLDGVRPWEFPKRHNQYKDEKNETLMENDILGQKVGVFLEWFTLPGDKSPFYCCELVMMCERGCGSRELNIQYSHLVTFEKQLAMDVCNRYESLIVNMKETAIRFAQKLLDSVTEKELDSIAEKRKLLHEDLKMTDTGRKRLMQLASTSTSTELESSLELKFLQMPKMHKLLDHCLQPPLTEKMDVFGYEKGVIETPLPEKCALVQMIGLSLCVSCIFICCYFPKCP